MLAITEVDCSPPLSHLRRVILSCPSASLLAPLCTLADDVERAALRGGRLLNAMYERSGHGAPVLQNCLHGLLQQCHRVMYNQLAMWMLHGVLLDPHEEFFVRQRGDRQDVEGVWEGSCVWLGAARFGTARIVVARLGSWWLG